MTRSTDDDRKRKPGARIILLGVAAAIGFFVSRELQNPKLIASTGKVSMTALPPETEVELLLEANTNRETNNPLLDLPPQTKTVIINVGSNRDPILPKKSSGPCALSIAFEPIVPELIPAHPQLYVVPAAVSSSSYLATMYAYNNDGLSSSLSKAAKTASWNAGKRNKGIKIVPVLSMVDVIRAIPSDVMIDFVQTDTQGHDYSILKSSVNVLRHRGTRYLRTEVWTNNVVTYQGVDNDLCRHWIPMMSQNGYSLVGIVHHSDHIFRPALEAKRTYCDGADNETRKPGLKEADALWKLSEVEDDPPVNLFQYPTHYSRKGQLAPAFSPEQLASCNS